MSHDAEAFNRRSLLSGIGRIAALSAVAPALMGASYGGGHNGSTLTPGQPESVGMSSDRIEDAFARLQRRVNDGLFPGAVALVARKGVIVGHRAFGLKVAGGDEPVTLDTIFDLQSMTKVLSTAICTMVLVRQGAIHLHDPVAAHLPGFAANGKGAITIRDMLRYSAGLPVDNQLLEEADTAVVWQHMTETPLEYAPGTTVLYSDVTYRLLGRLIEAVSGTDLDTFARAHVWGPLGMNDTMYNPPAPLEPRIAATAYSEIRGYLVRGEVQDEQDFALGGIVGCDGVFSTALDVAIFAQMFLNRGVYGGVRILPNPLIREMVKNQTPQVTAAATDVSPIENLLLAPKGYGWELSSHRFSTGGMRLSRHAYGKVGGAGTFVWVDPDSHLVAVLLTNHGLPVPFEEPGWNRLLDDCGNAEFVDGVFRAIKDC